MKTSCKFATSPDILVANATVLVTISNSGVPGTWRHCTTTSELEERRLTACLWNEYKATSCPWSSDVAFIIGRPMFYMYQGTVE